MKYDACDYDHSCYKHMNFLILNIMSNYFKYNENDFLENEDHLKTDNISTDLNYLYESMNDSLNVSKWKHSSQKYKYNYLYNLCEIREKISNNTYKTDDKSKRIINERGKPRFIKGNSVEDKVVRKNFCENVIMPIVERYLIYDNGASRKNKGVSFARDRLINHLHKFYRSNKTNIGYILLCDISKYYDNIRHDIAIEQFSKIIDDENTMNMVEEMICSMKVDVSFMSDEEYKDCMDAKFDSVKYAKIL